ncbi:MAG TPA: FlgD immunoglobulin-like domain containing protein [Candidatus Krumholzibacteria bacterium]|nr:FlgD immunoglobulin-like domain containing protein [Candidatus Krumholzibacteria bacterium]
MSTQDLRRLDPQLAYLALLTLAQLKPLSRWECALTETEIDVLRATVPHVRRIRRRTRLGRPVTETLIANDPARAVLYERMFGGRRLRRTPETVRREGRLLGYPSCCVEGFVREPYAANGMAPDDQEILFHWACPGCRVTPTLLREYRQVHADCSRLFRRVRTSDASPRWLDRAGHVAATVALVAGASGATTTDPHRLPAPDDLDGDHASVAEEILAGTDWERRDTDDDTVVDGVQIAQLLDALVESPPPGVMVTHHPQRGMETCPHCGATVNMGFVTVMHAQRELTIDLPYIALHYLEHGSLGFEGSIHAGRVDLDAAKRILFPCDAPHLLPLQFGDDGDEDGLYREEELVVGTDPDEPDSDLDTVPDGPQLAEELITLVSRLPREVQTDRPYLQEMRMDGLVQCAVCDAAVDMGFFEIVNPVADVSIAAPLLALHFVAKGCFDHAPCDWGKEGARSEEPMVEPSGPASPETMPRGVLPTVLRAVLTSQGPAHWVEVEGDTDGDGLTDAEEAALEMSPVDPDENGNVRPDGRELAALFARQIELLPEGPLADEPYRITHMLMGSEGCFTCGESWTMGEYQVVNPVAGVSIDVPFYNVHFMQHGSFSSDGLFAPRIDPVLLAQALGPHATGVEDAAVSSAFSFWNAPNPFASGTTTRIALDLPTAVERIRIAVYDAAGRRVRELYVGEGNERRIRLEWDGRDDRGALSSPGVYYCRARIGELRINRKITLVP